MTYSVYKVQADVEIDELRDTQRQAIYVYTTSKTKAERIVQKLFFDEHPHDLCKPGRRHVGLDRVVRGKTRRIRLLPDTVITGTWEDY